MAPTNNTVNPQQQSLAQNLLADRLSLFKDNSPATQLKADLLAKLLPGFVIDLPKPLPLPFPFPFPQPKPETTGNAKFDGLAEQVADVNKDIDSLLNDYQKALDAGEDTFVIQTKIQQAMQRRLELITLLSNLQKMEHDANMAVVNNIR